MDNVPIGSPTELALVALGNRDGRLINVSAGESSPYIRIEASWDDYLKSQSKKFRANLTRCARRVTGMGDAKMVWFGASGDADRLLQDIIQVEKRSWKENTGTSISSRPSELDYYKELLPALAQNGTLLANVLYIDNTPAAYSLCCNNDGWIGQLKTSFDRSLADAGAYTIAESVRRAFDLQAHEYDFLGDVAPHKLKWTNNVRAHAGHWIFSNNLIVKNLWRARQHLARFKRRVRFTTDSQGEADGS
jgi:CelD/BcsL family acetyltransferase involved in cellulose biosynthesis